jgi:hypothetical protein
MSSNFKDLLMGWTFTYFAFHLTVSAAHKFTKAHNNQRNDKGETKMQTSIGNEDDESEASLNSEPNNCLVLNNTS